MQRSWTTAWLLGAAVVAATPGQAAQATSQAASTQAARPAAEEAGGEVARLRRELDALREEYAGRLAALEARLSAIEASPQAAAPAPAAQPAPPQVAAQAPAGAATAAVPAGAAGGEGGGSLPVYGGGAASSKIFNPDIAAIGNFVGTAGDTPPGGGAPALQMKEAELSFQAIVDPYARADFFVTLSPEEVALEEGYITFPTLPAGLLGKVGKMRDAFGKVDGQHPHTLPWIDRPLMTQNLTGGEDGLADAGISLSRLLPNPWLFLEATGQVYRGESDVFKAPTRGDLAWVGHLRGYRDLSESTNLDLGGSIAYGHNGVGADTTTRLVGTDLTLRYRPLRRSIYTSLMVRGEATWSRREDAASPVDAFGAYASVDYQFARRWSAGVRLDSSERADNSALRDRGGSFVVTFRPSEFSLVRTQYRRTTFGEGSTANELLFQFLYSIGAHGAHPF